MMLPTMEQTAELQSLLSDIKTQFRLNMNGMASKLMRDRGLDYKLNFGIELPRLREIASHYAKNHELAQTLWKENIRESKIMAMLLQPVGTFYPEIAEIWIEDMHYPEQAELACQYLFQHLPYASEKAFEWMADEREYFQACGFLILARLLMRGVKLNERAELEYLDQAMVALQDVSPFVQRCAYASLVKYVQQGIRESRQALKILSPLRQSSDETVRQLYEQLSLVAED